jgi:hypothetical protein
MRLQAGGALFLLLSVSLHLHAEEKDPVVKPIVGCLPKPGVQGHLFRQLPLLHGKKAAEIEVMYGSPRKKYEGDEMIGWPYYGRENRDPLKKRCIPKDAVAQWIFRDADRAETTTVFFDKSDSVIYAIKNWAD